MLLKDYFPNLQKKYHELSFKGIAFNSQEVKEGYIFFAFKGNNTNGNFFIKDAIKNLIYRGEKFFGNIFMGKYLDCGTISGYIQSGIKIFKGQK